MKTPLCDSLGIQVPIFAFTRAREVVAEVTKAGGMGVLGAVGHSLEQLKDDLDWLKDNTNGLPWGVDVVMPAVNAAQGLSTDSTSLVDQLDKMIPQQHRDYLDELLAKYDVPELPPEKQAHHALLAWTEETARPQVELAMEYPIKLLANALGPPPKDIVDQAHDHGIKVAALAGAPRHAEKHRENGVDICVAQGTEAGGHCGEVSTMILIPDVVDAVSPMPVLAAGGIGCGRQVAAALALGAQGVWLGSVWLTAAESDVIPPIQKKLLAATSRDTVRSRALSGKPARQLKTKWSEAWDDPSTPTPLQVPLHFMLTADATTRIHHYAGDEKTNAIELATSPVGQIVGRMNEIRPTAEIMRSLIDEFHETARLLGDLSLRPAAE